MIQSTIEDIPTRVVLKLNMENLEKSPPMPFFIAFSGKKQVGKDSSTQMAVDLLVSKGKRVTVTAFAEVLKLFCIDVVGLSYDGVYGKEEQKNSLSSIMWDTMPKEIREKYSIETMMNTPPKGHPLEPIPRPRSGRMTNREVLQVIGTDIFRKINPNIWVEATIRRNWQKDADVVILTDCRFPNEKDMIEQKGGVVIRLERKTDLMDDHPSEIALDNTSFTYKYVNDGSINDLHFYVKSILTELKLI